jgi:tetratricopeptide (TPR) repeat protein
MTRIPGARIGLAIWVVLLLSGCATMAPRPVQPGDVPDLQERARSDPDDGDTQFLLAAALVSAGRCDDAVIAARRGRDLLPHDATGPILIGQCLEEAGEYDAALNLYAGYLFEYGDRPGAQAVEGRRVVALQLKARETAREALREEEALEPAEPETVGVLPFIVDGDPSYQALSVGLAHMLTTDLALLRRFPLVERAQLDALVQEMELAPELIDPTTAVRAGRLVRASRIVLGTVSVPSESETRLGSNIVLETGELVEPLAAEGELGDILAMEKELALGIAENLGYQLSEAERQRVLENQPASLAAFLAFARGLYAESLGDFEAAAAYYAEAVRADPGYVEAQSKLRGASGVGMGAAQIAGLTFTPETGPGPEAGFGPLANTIESSILDIASHQPERATIDAGSVSSVIDLIPEDMEILPALEALITIIITISR